MDENKAFLNCARASSDPPRDGVVYRDGRYILGWENETPCLIADGRKYVLTCHGYEPCLYITDGQGRMTAVHNAFNPLDVLDVFQDAGTITSITGFEYDAKDFCRMVEYAAGFSDVGIDDAEKVFAGRPKKKQPAQKKTEPAQEAAELPDEYMPSGCTCPADPFYALLAQYPDTALDCCIVKFHSPGSGPDAHRHALAAACRTLFADEEDGPTWRFDVRKARYRKADADVLFSSHCPDDRLNFRKAFLHPPYPNVYTESDFAKIKDALFPNGTQKLEIYEWSTDWSDYFNAGREWWGTLCLTVYDKGTDRFIIILASATD